MIICPECKNNPLSGILCDKCPNVHNNIINVTKETCETFNLETFKFEWPTYFKKYDRNKGEPRGGVIYQYDHVLKKLNMRDGVLLDFGCALAHASHTVKKHSSDITYIGADSLEGVLFAASEMYEADYLLNIDVKRVRTEEGKSELYMFPEPLRYIKDESVDLIVASRIAGWGQYDKFFPEFYRTLKPGGHLFFWSNAGFFDWKKKEMFEWLLENFEPLKKNKKFSEAESLSLMMWGNRFAFKKDEVSESELKHRFRGLMKRRLKDAE